MAWRKPDRLETAPRSPEFTEYQARRHADHSAVRDLQGEGPEDSHEGAVMECFCCRSTIALGRKVKIRRLIDWNPTTNEVIAWSRADWEAYVVYKEHSTYRWDIVCHACYRLLDNDVGAAEIGDLVFNIAGVSRRDKASVVDDARLRAWQEREARKLGSAPY